MGARYGRARELVRRARGCRGHESAARVRGARDRARRPIVAAPRILAQNAMYDRGDELRGARGRHARARATGRRTVWRAQHRWHAAQLLGFAFAVDRARVDAHECRARTARRILDVGASVARNDLAAAEQYLARVPRQARFAWIQGMSQSYAQTDPSAAAAWVEQFRTEPAYPTAVDIIAQGPARLDPQPRRGLLDRIATRSRWTPQTLLDRRLVTSPWLGHAGCSRRRRLGRRVSTEQRHEQRATPLQRRARCGRATIRRGTQLGTTLAGRLGARRGARRAAGDRAHERRARHDITPGVQQDTHARTRCWAPFIESRRATPRTLGWSRSGT